MVDISGEHCKYVVINLAPKFFNNFRLQDHELHQQLSSTLKYKNLYRLIEHVINAGIPLWNMTLGHLDFLDCSNY